MSENPFSNFDVYLFDGDGVIYRQNSPLPGAIDFIKLLQSLGKKIYILTNNSTQTREDYLTKFANLGIKLSLSQILTSAFLTAKYLANKTSNLKIYVVGENGLKQELIAQDLEVVNLKPEYNEERIQQVRIDDVNCVVTGMDRTLTYIKIARAMNILRNSQKQILFIATNADITFPTAEGLIPGGGAMIKLLEELSGRKIDAIIGKPQPQMYLEALELSNCKKSEAIMFGDRIETDILGAKKVGIATCLVMSGVTTNSDLKRLTEDNSPDIIINSLEDAFEAFRN
ncbi:MAG: HAD-IIA family hydrolase [Candidatus Heimdallarchaeaceae archaeon]